MANKKYDKLIEQLIKIGFNKYEAMVYITLIQNPEITAYEISKRSNVPQSKVYDTMKSIVDKGLAIVNGNKPIKYIAIPIDDFLTSYKKDIDDSVDFIKDNIKNIDSTPAADFMWHINGNEQVDEKLKSLLKNTKKSLYLSIWAEDFDNIYSDLEKLKKRNVEIVSVIYGKPKKEIGKIYYHEMHGMSEDVNINGKWMSVVADYEQCLFSIHKDNDSRGVWSKNKSFMLMAECFITHDIFISEIYLKFRDQMDKEFGLNMERIREKLSIG